MSASEKGSGFFKGGWAEFRDFAFKGNMIDLALAVVIGGAFKTVVDSLVNDIVVPTLNLAIGMVRMALTATTQPANGAALNAEVLPEKWKHINNFIGALINFLIMAFAMFLIFVKLIGTMTRRMQAPPPAGEPTTKECPLCLSIIPIKAKRCAHCAADLPATA